MKIVEDHPPNIEHIKAAFDIEGQSVVFTYGDTVYNPLKLPIPDHVLVHEAVHVKQQDGVGPERWWAMYIADPVFRLDQELQAYSAQYQYMKARCTNRQLSSFLFALAQDLSGPMYGNILTHIEAEHRIRTYAQRELAAVV